MSIVPTTDDTPKGGRNRYRPLPLAMVEGLCYLSAGMVDWQMLSNLFWVDSLRAARQLTCRKNPRPGVQIAFLALVLLSAGLKVLS